MSGKAKTLVTAAAIACMLLMLAVGVSCTSQNAPKKVTLDVTASDFSADGCTKAVVLLTDKDGATKGYAVTPNQKEQIELAAGEYKVSLVPSIDKDGAVYKPTADAAQTLNVTGDSAELKVELSKTALTTEELGKELEAVRAALTGNVVDEGTATEIINAYQSAYDSAVAAEAAKAEAEAKAAAEAERANAGTDGSEGNSNSPASAGSSVDSTNSSPSNSSSDGGGETIDYGVQKNTQTDNPEGAAGDKALGDEINKVFGSK